MPNIPDKILFETDKILFETAMTATGGGKGRVVSAEPKVALPGLQRALAEEIVEDAHQHRPYSNATRGNIDLVLTVL